MKQPAVKKKVIEPLSVEERYAQQNREFFIGMVARLGGIEEFQLGHSGAVREEFGEAAGHIARVHIDQDKLAAYIYDRVHDKSADAVRESPMDANRPHRRAFSLERTAAAKAADLVAVLLPGALAYDFEKVFAFTLRAVESIARSAASGERADHKKLLAGINSKLAQGLKALHRKAGRGTGAKDSALAPRRLDREKRDQEIDRLIVKARQGELGVDANDAASVEAWNESARAKQLARRYPLPGMKRPTLVRYITAALQRIRSAAAQNN